MKRIARYLVTALALSAPAALGLACEGACGPEQGAAAASSTGTATSSGSGAGRPDGGGSSSSQSSGSGAGGTGADPVWAPLTSTPVGCPVDRIVNASQVRAFTWQPCDGVAGCEQMVLLPILDGTYPGGVVEEEPGQTRIVFFGIGAEYRVVVFADQDGWLLDGYRSPQGGANDCMLFTGAARGEQSGVLVMSQINSPPGRLGGLVHRFGDPADPTPFEVTKAFGFGPAAADVPMAKDRWAWLCAPDRVMSVSTGDAGDLTVVAQSQAWDPQSPILAIDSLATNGSSFMLGEVMLTADGGATSIIATSDGKNPSTPYIVPGDDSWYDNGVYAGPYVAWLRGIGWKDINSFAKVELWAAAYDPDPSKLVPFKVDDYGFPFMDDLLGAAGRVASLAPFTAPDGPTTTRVWDLATKKVTLYTLPDGQEVSPPYLGLTSTHLWVEASQHPFSSNPVDMYVRFALE